MISDTTTADGPAKSPLPLWQETTARVRRLQRAQLIMLLAAGAAILLVVVAGGLKAADAVATQNEAEERAEGIRSLRGEFVVKLFEFETEQGFAPVAGGTIDQGALLEFAGLALQAITLANSYDPPNAAERAARDAVLDIYNEFTDLQATQDPAALDATLLTDGPDLATEAIARFDAWSNANARSLMQSRDEQDRLIAQIAITIVAVVLLMSVGVLLTWWLMEKARKQALAEAWAQTRWFDSLVRNASDMVIVVDGSGAIMYCSESVPRLLGWSHGELREMPFAELVHPDDHDALARVFDDPGTDDDAPDPITWRFRHSDGPAMDVETLATHLLDDPSVSGIVLNSRDITDRKVAERELEHLALHDPVTGLANRVLFEDRLSHALRARGRSGDELAILMLDLDDFKTVNDGLGHHAGDELLAAVGQRISGCIRPGDTAARLGGDEYGVLLTAIAGPAAARAVAQRVYDAVRTPTEIAGEQISISASVGIALAPHHGDDPVTLLRYADLAMYAAKKKSGDHIVSFSGDMEQALEERVRLRTDLASAVAAGDELALEYQPIMHLATGSMVGLEALLRWDHPALGRVRPDRFIPLAEETGLIVPIGEHVIRTACMEAAAWNDAGRDLTVSVNLSARQLEDDRLVNAISQALREAGLPPHKLTLEVTESILMENLGDAVAVLESAKELGIRVAIDDFGTGYSSLSQLGRLPVDVVKIDKSFVSRLSGGTADSDLAGVIVRLGAVLQLQTVAEGIEDEEQLAALRQLGCEYGQGYLFARPMPPNEVDALLAEAGEEIILDGSTARR